MFLMDNDCNVWLLWPERRASNIVVFKVRFLRERFWGEWRVDRCFSTVFTSQMVLYLGRDGFNWKTPFNKRHTSGFVPNVPPSGSDNWRQGTPSCVDRTISYPSIKKLSEDIDPFYYSGWKWINVPWTTVPVPFLKIRSILFVCTWSPGLLDNVGSWLLKTLTLKVSPDKLNIKRRSFLWSGWTVSGWLGKVKVFLFIGNSRRCWMSILN